MKVIQLANPLGMISPNTTYRIINQLDKLSFSR